MQKITIISLVALVIASAWLGSAPANKLDVQDDKLGFTIDEATPNSLPADHEEPQAAAADLAASPAAGVSYVDQVVTEYVQQRVCDGRTCRIVSVPRQVVRRAAVAAARPFRTARVLYQDGITRTLELLRPVGAVATCTRSITQAQTGEQWVGTDQQIYVRQADGTWKPKRDDARIPAEASLSPPAVVMTTPIVAQRVFYTQTVTTQASRARTPVFTRRCGPVRRLLGWCR